MLHPFLILDSRFWHLLGAKSADMSMVLVCMDLNIGLGGCDNFSLVVARAQVAPSRVTGTNSDLLVADHIGRNQGVDSVIVNDRVNGQALFLTAIAEENALVRFLWVKFHVLTPQSNDTTCGVLVR